MGVFVWLLVMFACRRGSFDMASFVQFLGSSLRHFSDLAYRLVLDSRVRESTVGPGRFDILVDCGYPRMNVAFLKTMKGFAEAQVH